MKNTFLLISATLLATSTHAQDFVCPEPFGFYPNPNNCIKYYQCSNDIPVEFICDLHPDTGHQMHYDEENVWCEEPSKVDCGDRPICDANDQNCVEQTTPDPDAWQCPDAWGYFPDPESCCQFYICEDDMATLEVCPTANGEQLNYAEALTACDYPDRVDCGSRPQC